MRWLVLVLLVGCSPLSASETRNVPGSAPFICLQSASNELTKAEALELCAGAHSDPFICYRIATSNGLSRADALKLCKGA